ncbi:MAG: hypothetical protein ACOCVF_02530 [bacterium]
MASIEIQRLKIEKLRKMGSDAAAKKIAIAIGDVEPIVEQPEVIKQEVIEKKLPDSGVVDLSPFPLLKDDKINIEQVIEEVDQDDEQEKDDKVSIEQVIEEVDQDDEQEKDDKVSIEQEHDKVVEELLKDLVDLKQDEGQEEQEDQEKKPVSTTKKKKRGRPRKSSKNKSDK